MTNIFTKTQIQKKKKSKALSTDPYKKKTETNLSIPFQIGSERECQHHRMYVNNWAYQTIKWTIT